MIFDISHRTHYRYTSSVVQSQHLLHMSPRQVPKQVVRNHSLLIEPAPAYRVDGIDAFGNPMVTLEIEVPHKELILHSRSTVETLGHGKLEISKTTAWDQLDASLNLNAHERDVDVLQFRCASRLTPTTLDIFDYARQSLKSGRPVLEAAMDLTLRMYDDFTFDPHATDISTPVWKVFRERRGVCQDFAHVALACFRAAGVPARYVSGYLHTHPPAGQPKLQGADATHAWVSVWSPEYGWIDFDPTNGMSPNEEHVTVAYGRDYDDVSPIVGVLRGGGEHTVSVAVDVAAISEIQHSVTGARAP